MLDLARTVVPAAEAVRRVVLPDDAVPEADAIVGVGHALNYLPSVDAVDRALTALARALSPGGLLAIDLCALEWAEIRRRHAEQRADRRRLGRHHEVLGARS